MIALSDTLNYYGAYSKAPTLTRPLISPFQHPAHFQIIIKKKSATLWCFFLFSREKQKGLVQADGGGKSGPASCSISGGPRPAIKITKASYNDDDDATDNASRCPTDFYPLYTTICTISINIHVCVHRREREIVYISIYSTEERENRKYVVRIRLKRELKGSERSASSLFRADACVEYTHTDT